MQALSRAGLAVGLLCASAAHGQVSNPSLATAPDQPERIQPGYQERGVDGYAGPAAASSQSGQTTGLGSDGASSASGTGLDTSVAPGEGGQSLAMTAMLSTSYGATAASTASQTGVNAEAVAAIGQAESKFQNVPTANGTSAATGPWQIVPGTFAGTSQKYGLGYTAADITNPQAQAVEASYIIKDTAAAVSAATNQPATVAQTYAGYVFGPSNGAKIAASNDDVPLRANDDETSSPRKFSLEGAEGSSCSCP
jgi:hypothetical protein